MSAALPSIAGTCSGPLMVMGAARCLWDDLAAYDHLHAGDRMAVNRTAEDYHAHRLDHIATVYPEMLPPMLDVRRRQGAPELQTHVPDRLAAREQYGAAAVKNWWPAELFPGGTSALFAVLAGLAMGYAPVVLAGVPLDNSGHYYDQPGRPPRTTDIFIDSHTERCWLTARDTVFAGRVTSLSGRTREWLGAPPEAKETAA